MFVSTVCLCLLRTVWLCLLRTVCHVCFNSKAFDQVNHWTLFAKLIETQLTQWFTFCYFCSIQMEQVYIKWGKSCSTYFTICNGVRQSGILSPQLLALYVNQLTNKLTACKDGCCRWYTCIFISTNSKYHY